MIMKEMLSLKKVKKETMKDIVHEVRREIIKKKKIVAKNLRKINTQTQKMNKK